MERDKVASATRSLVNARGLQLSVQGFCMRYCLCLFSCTVVRMIWKENKSFRIRAVQMDNLRSLLGIRRMDKVPNAEIRKLCGTMKGVDEKADEGGSAVKRE